MVKNETYKVVVPLEELDDSEVIEARFAEIHEEFSKDPDARIVALRGLIDGIRLRRSDETLSDNILEQVIAMQKENHGASVRRSILNTIANGEAKEPSSNGPALVIEYDEGEQHITGVYKRTELPPENERAVEAKRNMQNRLPSGPKQNESSGGLRIVPPESRH